MELAEELGALAGLDIEGIFLTFTIEEHDKVPFQYLVVLVSR